MKLTREWVFSRYHGGNWLYTLTLPEGLPEWHGSSSSSGTKNQMVELAKKFSAKYGWTLKEETK